jgi:CheY-like chemotaxis protein
MSVNFCCCFYPTTVVCVDDDVHLLKWMTLLLEDKFIVKPFFNPLECVQFVKAAGVLDSKSKLAQSIYDADVSYLGLYVNKIHELIYDAGRVEEISTLVVDYYMPGIDGLEVCKIFKTATCKKIMLTGEVDQSMAVAAFNDEIIDQFVMKGQAQVMEDLQVQIERMQWQYFIEKTRFLSESLLQTHSSVFSYLADMELCEALNALLQEHEIKEIYLFNNEGDYVLIDKAHNLWWLSIKNQYTLQALIQDAENEFLQEPSPEAEAIFDMIKKEQKLPLTVLSKKVLDICNWERILVKPISVITAKENYQILLTPDIGQANLRYKDIKFV